MKHPFLESDLYYNFKRTPVAVLSFFVFLIIVIMAIFADIIAPHTPFEPLTLNLLNGFTPPMQANEFTGTIFLMGTDDQGRDLFSTILFGLRISLFVGLMAVFLAMVIGVTLGLIAGFVGGVVDTVIMRFADIQITFPSILVAMLIYGVAKGLLPPDLRYEMSITVLIISIGLSEWVPFARTVRGSTLVEKEKEYVISAIFVAFGTSLPELVTALIACWKKKDADLITGNIIGSNIFNVAFVLASLGGYTMVFDRSFNFEITVLLGASLFLLFLTVLKKNFFRFSGAAFLLIYVGVIWKLIS